MKGTQITPDAVSPGTFNEHLQGLRRGNIPDHQRIPPKPPVFEPEPATQPTYQDLRPGPTTTPANQQTVETGGSGRTDPDPQR